MTVDQAKSSQTKAEAEFSTAASEVVEAREALNAANRAYSSEEPATKEQVATREMAVYAARSRLARTEAAERRAVVALNEARERVARLAPHAATLAKLDRALAAVASKDAAITALGLDLYARLAAEVADLRRLIVEANAVYTTLPVPVRTADLSAPFAVASSWGTVGPESDALLGRLDTAVFRRLGRWPNADDLKARGARGVVA